MHGLTVALHSDGVLTLAVLAVFLAGIALGGFLYAFTSQPGPIQVAQNDFAPAVTLPHNALTIRQ